MSQSSSSSEKQSVSVSPMTKDVIGPIPGTPPPCRFCGEKDTHHAVRLIYDVEYEPGRPRGRVKNTWWYCPSCDTHFGYKYVKVQKSRAVPGGVIAKVVKLRA